VPQSVLSNRWGAKCGSKNHSYDKDSTRSVRRPSLAFFLNLWNQLH